MPLHQPLIHRRAVLLRSLSDPTRLHVLAILATEGPIHVGAICARLGQTQPAVSHHLALLRHAGLIVPERRGKNNFYSLTAEREAEIRCFTVGLEEPSNGKAPKGKPRGRALAGRNGRMRGKRVVATV